jgi:hypothetical protein
MSPSSSSSLPLLAAPLLLLAVVVAVATPAEAAFFFKDRYAGTRQGTSCHDQNYQCPHGKVLTPDSGADCFGRWQYFHPSLSADPLVVTCFDFFVACPTSRRASNYC